MSNTGNLSETPGTSNDPSPLRIANKSLKEDLEKSHQITKDLLAEVKELRAQSQKSEEPHVKRRKHTMITEPDPSDESLWCTGDFVGIKDNRSSILELELR